MKRIIFILLIISVVMSSNNRFGLIKNLVLPGSGMPNIQEYRDVKKQYLLREVLIWGALFSSRQSSDIYENNYINYGIDYSDSNVSNFNYQYAINVGNYDSMYDYNEAMLRKRLPENLYSEDEGYDWNWDSSSNRLKYRDMLRKSRDFDKIGDFAIASLLIHRVISIINHIYITNKGKSLGISSNIYKIDSETLQLEFKFNL